MNRRTLLKAFLIVLTAALFFGWSAQAATKYATLEFGSRGSAVLKLQKALLALGFDPSGTDGKFGRGTENAVIAYQTSKGLTADGKAGNLTQTAIYADSGTTGSTDSSNASSTSSTLPGTLKYGDSGNDVVEMQQALAQLGFYTGTLDARFGAGTQKAVIAFQKSKGLKADGLAGSKTLEALYSAASGGTVSGGSSETTADSTSSGNTSSSTSSSTGFTRTLRKGYKGNDVTAVQQRLKDLGYYAGTVDGSYGTGTVAAVSAFQTANGLTVDGLTGSVTYARLMSSDAVAVGGSSGTTTDSSASTGTTTDSSASAGTTIDSSTSTGNYATLKLNSSGEAVTNLQTALKNLGYTVEVTGTYDSTTRSAVIAFQQRNSLTADGVAGALTQAALYSGNANNASTSVPEIDANAGKTDGPATSSVQLLHWFNDVKPSIRAGQTYTVFDPATNLSWTLRFYSLGRHADSEPLTLTDTQIMYRAFGNTNTWTPKPVYVKLPDGRWTLATMHNVPHLSGSIKDNGFDGHLCVHFLRDMSECEKNDPNYGVQHQNAIRKKWKQMTGQEVAYQ